MNAYFIERPEVSAGLRRTFHKKLEVFYGVFAKPRTYSRGYGTTETSYFTVFEAKSIYTYNAKKGVWVKKPSNKYISCSIPTAGIHSNAEVSTHCAYNNLEAACAAKIILINRMAESYKRAIQELQDLFERNVPNTQQPLEQLLDTHPDLFI